MESVNHAWAVGMEDMSGEHFDNEKEIKAESIDDESEAFHEEYGFCFISLFSSMILTVC